VGYGAEISNIVADRSCVVRGPEAQHKIDDPDDDQSDGRDPGRHGEHEVTGGPSILRDAVRTEMDISRTVPLLQVSVDPAYQCRRLFGTLEPVPPLKAQGEAQVINFENLGGPGRVTTKAVQADKKLFACVVSVEELKLEGTGHPGLPMRRAELEDGLVEEGDDRKARLPNIVDIRSLPRRRATGPVETVTRTAPEHVHIRRGVGRFQLQNEPEARLEDRR